MNKKVLMRHYNKAKNQWDKKRADKALGYVMSGKLDDKIQEYNTTRNHCDCPDAIYRGSFCCHRIAIQIRDGYEDELNSNAHFVISAISAIA